MSKLESLSFSIKGLSPESKQSLQDAITLEAAYKVSHGKPLPDYNNPSFIESLKETIENSDVFLLDKDGNLIGQKSEVENIKGFKVKTK